MAEKVTYAWLRWAGGEHRFQIDLTAPEAVLLGIPRDPYARLQRLMTGGWSPDDVMDTVRQGLGRDQFQARAVVAEASKGRPIGEFLPLAQTILAVAIFGIDKAVADAVSAPADITPEAGNGD